MRNNSSPYVNDNGRPSSKALTLVVSLVIAFAAVVIGPVLFASATSTPEATAPAAAVTEAATETPVAEAVPAEDAAVDTPATEESELEELASPDAFGPDAPHPPREGGHHDDHDRPERGDHHHDGDHDDFEDHDD